uniref:Lipoxygenase n=1 Tax=Salix viminalis TaxID=40686 RepID=A0A6N2MN37_SALVM
MLMPQVHRSLYPSKTSLILPKPRIYSHSHAASLVPSRSSFTKTKRNGRVGYKTSNNVKAIATEIPVQRTKFKANVTVKRNDGSKNKQSDWTGGTLRLELVFADLDPDTGEVRSLTARASQAGQADDDVLFEAEFEVPPDYGEVGAVFVTNELSDEAMFIKKIVLDGSPHHGRVLLTCQAWVRFQQKRLFFTNKSTYLPGKTPSGLRRLRKVELENLRGNCQGERKKGDRIYDYDVYNDLGDPDSPEDLTRPVLGGKELPYPRRCRTGRPVLTKKEPSMETRSEYIYVPQDEEFSNTKQKSYRKMQELESKRLLFLALQTGRDDEAKFPYFTAIDVLFNEGINLPSAQLIMQRVLEAVDGKAPQVMKRDRFCWVRDEEFARQTLAGVNPSSIQLVTEWPLRSKLDPEIYGAPESAITDEMIEEEIKPFTTVEEAVKQKKLFILDYHDLLLPFVRQVRELGSATLYGSRTLFFLTPQGRLRPLAIELTRPKMDGNPQWKKVFRPTWKSTDVWLWRLAKANVLAHDSCYHQLITHWLRTHCATEPYVIAANRQLSAMHPIYRLLHPHFRYTMEINAEARKSLINAGGTIESTFSPGKYSMELSSVVYDKQWRFDHQGLPMDLISRGMAIEDPTSPHGLKLAVEDYPYANDGLELWAIIKKWVSDYANHYYPEASLIESDSELLAWWEEVRTVGHGDKKDEPWWPELRTPQDLIEIITTIVWVASGHHAAVNFGQYAYAGYFPNRPPITRRKMPNEDPKDEDWKLFLEKPVEILLETFPSQLQAATVMVALKVLSEHSPDEEYLGEKIEPVWAEDPVIKSYFEKFHGSLIELERIIDRKNADENFVNRHGAGVMPYELLKPFSKPGITGQGVPYSISI